MRWLVSALGALTLWAAYPGLVSAQSNPGAVAPAAPAPVDFRDQSNFGVTFLDQDTFSVAQPFPTGDTSITLKWRATKQGSDGTVTADIAPAGSKLMVAVASLKTEVRYSGSTVTTVEVPDEVTLVTLPYSSTIPDGGLQSGTLTFRIPQTIRTKLSTGSNPLPFFLAIVLVKPSDYDADRGINYLSGRPASAIKITATGGVESELDKKGFSGLEVVIPGDANPARSGKEAAVGHRLLAPTDAGGPSYGLATSANPTRLRYFVEKTVTEGSNTIIRRYLTFFGSMTDDLIAGYSAAIPTTVGASALDVSKRVLMPYGDNQFALDTSDWTLSVLVTAGPGAGLLFKSAGNFSIKGYLNMAGSGSPLPSFTNEVRVGVQDGVVIPDTIAIPADNEAGFPISSFYVKVNGLNPSSSDADTTKVRIVMSEVDSNNGRPSPYWLTLKSDINFSHAGITAGATLSSAGLFFNVPITIPTGPDGKDYFFCLHVYSGEGQNTPNGEMNARPMNVGEDSWGSRRLYQGAYACKVVRVTGGSRSPNGLTPISGVKLAMPTVDATEVRAGGQAKAQWTLPVDAPVGFDLTQSKVRVTLYIPSPPNNYWFSTAVVLTEGTSAIGSNDLTVTIPAWFARPGFEELGFTALRVTIVEGPGLGLEWNNINGSPDTRPAIKAASTTATPQITWSWPQAGSVITSDQSNSVSIVVSAIGDATKRSVLQDYTRALIYMVPATVTSPSIGCSDNVALHNSVMGFHTDGTSSFINADLWPSSQTISSLSSSCFSSTKLDSSGSTQSWKLALVIEPGNSNSNELTSRVVVYSETFSFVQGNNNNNNNAGNGTHSGHNNRGYDPHEPLMFYDSNSRGIVMDLEKPPAMPIPAGQTLNLLWNCTTAAFNQNEVPQPCTFPANSRIVPALVARQQGGWAQDSSGNPVPSYWPSETLIIKLSEGVVLSSASGRGSIAYTVPSTVRTNRSATESIPWFMTLVVIPPQNNGQPSDATESLYGITNYASFAVPALFKGGRVDDSATLDYPLITLQSINPPATAEGGSSVRAGSDAVFTFKVAAPLNGKPTYSSTSTRFRVIVMVPNPRGSNNEATVGDKLFFQAQFQGYLGWDSFSSSRDLNNNGNPISLPAVGGVETTFYRSVSMPHRDASLAYDQPQATLSIVVVSGPGAGLQFNLGSAFQLKGFLNLQAPGAIGSSGESNLVTLSFTTAFASSIVLSSSSSQNVVLGFTGLPASPSSKVAFFGAEISSATGLPYPAFALKPSETINTNQKTVTLPQTLPTSNSDTRNEADSRKFLLCAAITDNTDGSKSPQNEAYDKASRRLYPGAYTCVVSSLSAGSLYTGFSAVTSLNITNAADASQQIVAGGQVRVTWSLSSPVTGFDSTSKARIGVFDFQDLDPFTSSPKFVGIVAENLDVRSGTATGTLPAWLTRKNANYLMLAVAIQVYDGPGTGYSMTNFQLNGNNNGPSWLQLTPSTVETPQITVAQPSGSSVWRVGDAAAPVRWNIPALSASTKRSVFAEETMVDLYIVKATASPGAAINNNEGMYLLQLPLGAKYDGSASNFIGNISIPNYSLTGLDASTSTKGWKLELRIYGSGRDEVTSPIYFQSAAFTLLAFVNGGNDNNGGNAGAVDGGGNNNNNNNNGGQTALPDPSTLYQNQGQTPLPMASSSSNGPMRPAFATAIPQRVVAGTTQLTINWKIVSSTSETTAMMPSTTSYLQVFMLNAQRRLDYGGYPVNPSQLVANGDAMLLPLGSSLFATQGRSSGSFNIVLPATLATKMLASDPDGWDYYFGLFLVDNIQQGGASGSSVYSSPYCMSQVMVTGGSSPADLKGFPSLTITSFSPSVEADGALRSGREARLSWTLGAPSTNTFDSQRTRLRVWIRKMSTVDYRKDIGPGGYTEAPFDILLALYPNWSNMGATDAIGTQNRQNVLLPRDSRYASFSWANDQPNWKVFVQVVSGPGVGLVFSSSSNYDIKGYLWMQNNGAGGQSLAWSSDATRVPPSIIAIPQTATAATVDDAFTMTLGFKLNDASGNSADSKARVVALPIYAPPSSFAGKPAPPAFVLARDVVVKKDGTENTVDISIPMTLSTAVFNNNTIGVDYIIAVHITSGPASAAKTEWPDDPLLNRQALAMSLLFSNGTYLAKKVRITLGSRYDGYQGKEPTNIQLVPIGTNTLTAGRSARLTWQLPDDTGKVHVNNTIVAVTAHTTYNQDGRIPLFGTGFLPTDPPAVNAGRLSVDVKLPAWAFVPDQFAMNVLSDSTNNFIRVGLRIEVVGGPGLGLSLDTIRYDQNGNPTGFFDVTPAPIDNDITVRMRLDPSQGGSLKTGGWNKLILSINGAADGKRSPFTSSTYGRLMMRSTIQTSFVQDAWAGQGWATDDGSAVETPINVWLPSLPDMVLDGPTTNGALTATWQFSFVVQAGWGNSLTSNYEKRTGDASISIIRGPNDGNGGNNNNNNAPTCPGGMMSSWLPFYACRDVLSSKGFSGEEVSFPTATLDSLQGKVIRAGDNISVTFTAIGVGFDTKFALAYAPIEVYPGMTCRPNVEPTYFVDDSSRYSVVATDSTDGLTRTLTAKIPHKMYTGHYYIGVLIAEGKGSDSGNGGNGGGQGAFAALPLWVGFSKNGTSPGGTVVTLPRASNPLLQASADGTPAAVAAGTVMQVKWRATNADPTTSVFSVLLVPYDYTTGRPRDDMMLTLASDGRVNAAGEGNANVTIPDILPGGSTNQYVLGVMITSGKGSQMGDPVSTTQSGSGSGSDDGENAYATEIITLTTASSSKTVPTAARITLTKPGDNEAVIPGFPFPLSYLAPRSTASLTYEASFAQLTLSRAPNQTVMVLNPMTNLMESKDLCPYFVQLINGSFAVGAPRLEVSDSATHGTVVRSVPIPLDLPTDGGEWWLTMTIVSGKGLGITTKQKVRVVPTFNASTNTMITTATRPGSLGFSKDGSKQLQLISPGQQGTVNAGAENTFVWRYYGANETTTKLTIALTPYNELKQLLNDRRVVVSDVAVKLDLDAATQKPRKIVTIPSTAVNGFSQLSISWQGQHEGDAVVSTVNVTVAGGASGLPFIKLLTPADNTVPYLPGSIISVSFDYANLNPEQNVTISLTSVTVGAGGDQQWIARAGGKSFVVAVPAGLDGRAGNKWKAAEDYVLALTTRDPTSSANPPASLPTTSITGLKIRDLPKIATAPQTCKDQANCVALVAGDAKTNGQIKAVASILQMPPNQGAVLALCHVNGTFPQSPAASQDVLKRAGLYSVDATSSADAPERCFLIKQLSARGGSDSTTYEIAESFKIPASAAAKDGYFVVTAIMPLTSQPSVVLPDGPSFTDRLTAEAALSYPRVRASNVFNIAGGDASSATITIYIPSSITTVSQGESLGLGFVVNGLDPTVADSAVKVEVLDATTRAVVATPLNNYRINSSPCYTTQFLCAIQYSFVVPASITPAVGGADKTYVFLVSSLATGGTGVKAQSQPFVVKAQIPQVFRSIILNRLVSNAEAPFSSFVGTAPALKVGESVKIAWNQTSSMRGPYAVSLHPINCAGANPIVLNSAYPGTAFATSEMVTGVIPADYVLPPACATAGTPPFVPRVSVNSGTMTLSGAGIYLIPAAGVMRVLYPSKGQRFASGSKFNLLFEASGFTGAIKFTFHFVKPGTATNPPTLDGAYPASLTEPSSGEVYGKIEDRITAAALVLPDGKSEVTVVAKAEQGTLVAWSEPFVVFAPPNKFLSALLESTGDATYQKTGTSPQPIFAPGNSLKVSWTQQGFTPNLRVIITLMNNRDSPKAVAVLSPADGVSIADGSYKFRLPAFNVDATTKTMYFVAVGVVGFMSCDVMTGNLVATELFTIQEPTSSAVFVRSVVDPSVTGTAPAINSDLAGFFAGQSGCVALLSVFSSPTILSLGSTMRITWESTSDQASIPFKITLMNRADSTINVVLRASAVYSTASNRVIDVELSPNLDTSASKANLYFIRVQSTAGTIFTDSPVFSLRQPFGRILVSKLAAPPSTTAATSFPASQTSTPSSVAVYFSAFGLPLVYNGVRIVLRNKYLTTLSFDLTAATTVSADEGLTGVTVTLPTTTQLFAAGVNSATLASGFVFRVSSTAFPAISGQSREFEITAVSAAEKQICVTMIGQPTTCILPTYVSGWAAIVDGEGVTFNYKGSGFNDNDRVLITIKNSLVPSVSRALCTMGSSCPTFAAGGLEVSASLTVGTGTRGLFAAVSSVPGAKDAFYLVVEVYPDGTANPPPAASLIKSIFTPFFTIRSSVLTALGFLKLLTPKASFNAAPGSTVNLRYQGVGLGATDSVTVQLVNMVLGTTITLSSGLPTTSDTTDIPLTIPGDAKPTAATTTGAQQSWRLKIFASASIFDVSPYFSVFAPGIKVSRPAGTTGKVGESLEIAFDALALSGNVEIHLMNDVATDSVTTIADSLQLSESGTTNTLTWVIPDTVSVKASVASAYYVRVRSLSDSSVVGRSGGFTIRGTEKALSIITPAPQSQFLLGQEFRITFSGNGLRGAVRATLMNEATGKRIDVMTQTGVTTVDASSTTPVISWTLPTDHPVLSSQGSSSTNKWFLLLDTEASAATPAKVGPLTIKPLETPITVDLRVPTTGVKLGANLEFAFSLSPDAASSADFATMSVTLRNKNSASFSRVLSTALAASAAGQTKSYVVPTGLQVGGAIGSSYFIRIASATNAAYFSDSDVFSVVKKDASIRITNFLSGSPIYKGDSVRVSWDAVGIDPDASVSIYLTNGKTQYRSLVSEVSVFSGNSSGLSTSSVLSESVVLPLPKDLSLPAADKRSFFAFEVVLTADTTVFGASPDLFTINPPRRALRVVNPSTVNGQPVFASTAGTKIPIEFLGRGIGGMTVKVSLRNASIPASRLSTIADADLENIATVLTLTSATRADDVSDYLAESNTYRSRRCPTERTNAIVGLSNDAADDVTCGAFTVTLTPAIESALSTAKAYGRENPFSFRVTLVDDDTIVAESPVIVFRPSVVGFVPPVITSPAQDELVAAGSTINVRWANATIDAATVGLANVKVSLNCSIPGSPMPMEVVSLQPMTLNAANTAATSGSGIALRIPLLALDAPLLKSCFVVFAGQATAARPQDGAMQIFSARFAVRRAAISISFVTPGPLTAATVDVAASVPSALTKRLSGADFAATWAYGLEGSAVNPSNPPAELVFSSVGVQIVRLGAGGIPDVPIASYPLATATAGALVTSIASGQVVPSSAPFGVYYLLLSAVPQGWRGDKVVAQSQPFLITPAESSLTIDEQPTSLVVGRLLTIIYTPKAIAGENNVKVTIRAAGSAVASATVLAEKLPCSGIFKAPLPTTLAAGSYVVRLEVLEDNTVFAETTAIAVTVPDKVITVTSPALDNNRVIPVWTASDLISISFTATGFATDAVFNVTLEQDRYLLGSADRTIAVISDSVTLTSGAATLEWSVPSDLNSTVATYVRVSLVTTEAKKPWARSCPVNLRSKPVSGFKEWLAALCVNSGSNLATSLRPLCKLTPCDCVNGGGAWLGAVSLNFDFAFSWPGSSEGYNAVKNAMGSFASDGVNICWPKEALAASTGNTSSTEKLPAGTYQLLLPSNFIASASINDLTAGNIATAGVVMRVSGAFNPIATVATCSAIAPQVRATLTLSGLSTTDWNSIQGQFQETFAGLIGASPGDVQIASSSGDSSARRLLLDTATTASSDARALTGQVMSTKLLISITATDDSSAQTIQEAVNQVNGRTFTGTGSRRVRMLVANFQSTGSGTAYTGDSQSSVDASSGTSQSLYTTTTDSGAANRPAGGDDASADLSTDAYSSGEFAKQKNIAAARDSGKAAVTSGGGGGGGGGTTDNGNTGSSTNVAAIAGGVVGGVVAIALIVGLSVYFFKGKKATGGAAVAAAAVGGSSSSPAIITVENGQLSARKGLVIPDSTIASPSSGAAVSPLQAAAVQDVARQRAQQLQFAQTQVSSKQVLMSSSHSSGVAISPSYSQRVAYSPGIHQSGGQYANGV